MSFLVPCPNCGLRSVYEFRFGGEVRQVPALNATRAEWQNYRFHRTNAAGIQNEWWFHSAGCRQWLQAVRNTVSNEVLEANLIGENH